MLGWKKWLVAAALVSGCIMTDGGGTTSSGEGSGPPLIVRNNSSTKICYIQVSHSSESTWGPDQLGEHETLDPGGYKGWNLPSAGEWDLRLLDCQQNSLLERRISVPDSGAEVAYP